MAAEPTEISHKSRFSGIPTIAAIRSGSWLTPGRLTVYPKLVLAVYVAMSILWIVQSHGLMDRFGHPIGADFIDPWSASSLALKGTPAAVYDVPTLWQAEKTAIGSPLVPFAGFHYPPMYLLVILPLALLPYIWSLLVWSVLTFGAYLIVLREIDPEPSAMWLAIAFPGAMVNLTNGQNGALTMVLLGGALLLLDRRPILAGVFFGLMVYKPQFGVLVPLFLVVTGRWRTFVAASVTVVGFAGLSLAAFGTHMWLAFFKSTSFTRHVVLEQGGAAFGKFQSTFAAARMWGVGIPASYGLQGVVALLTAIAVIWVWRRNARADLQAAALAVGALLVTPYMMDYDLAVLALPIAWLATEGRKFGFLSWEKSLLAAAWALPIVARPAALRLGIPLTPILLLALVAMVVRRTASHPSMELRPTDAS